MLLCVAYFQLCCVCTVLVFYYGLARYNIDPVFEMPQKRDLRHMSIMVV